MWPCGQVHGCVVLVAIVLWIVELKDRCWIDIDWLTYTLTCYQAAVTFNSLIHSLTQHLKPLSTTNSAPQHPGAIRTVYKDDKMATMTDIGTHQVQAQICRSYEASLDPLPFPLHYFHSSFKVFIQYWPRANYCQVPRRDQWTRHGLCTHSL